MKRIPYALKMGAVVATALFSLSVGAQQSLLPKQGQFSGKFGWWAVGKVMIWVRTRFIERRCNGRFQ